MILFGALALDYTPKRLKLSVGSQATFNGNFASHPLLLEQCLGAIEFCR
jgi:hypothetical protein